MLAEAKKTGDAVRAKLRKEEGGEEGGGEGEGDGGGDGGSAAADDSSPAAATRSAQVRAAIERGRVTCCCSRADHTLATKSEKRRTTTFHHLTPRTHAPHSHARSKAARRGVESRVSHQPGGARRLSWAGCS